MEIIIGRDAITSQLSITANGQEKLIGKEGSLPPTVSPQHCKLIINDKGIRLRNLDINNFTYVNGQGVESKGVTLTDKIELGPGRYLLDWESVSSFLPADIRPLEKVWNEYERERMELQITERRFNSLRSATGLITMAAIVLGIMTGRQSFWYIVIYVVAILISLGFTIKAWRNASLVPQKSQRLNQQFQHDYVCPHCGRFLGNQSYQILSQNDHCPYCKTQFIL